MKPHLFTLFIIPSIALSNTFTDGSNFIAVEAMDQAIVKLLTSDKRQIKLLRIGPWNRSYSRLRFL
jgi:hypothetical protein